MNSTQELIENFMEINKTLDYQGYEIIAEYIPESMYFSVQSDLTRMHLNVMISKEQLRATDANNELDTFYMKLKNSDTYYIGIMDNDALDEYRKIKELFRALAEIYCVINKYKPGNTNKFAKKIAEEMDSPEKQRAIKTGMDFILEYTGEYISNRTYLIYSPNLNVLEQLKDLNRQYSELILCQTSDRNPVIGTMTEMALTASILAFLAAYEVKIDSIEYGSIIIKRLYTRLHEILRQKYDYLSLSELYDFDCEFTIKVGMEIITITNSIRSNREQQV